jgi:hypothetical protein
MQPDDVSGLLGSWTYRSLVNDSDISTGFVDLEFGRGELHVERWNVTGFAGRLGLGEPIR